MGKQALELFRFEEKAQYRNFVRLWNSDTKDFQLIDPSDPRYRSPLAVVFELELPFLAPNLLDAGVNPNICATLLCGKKRRARGASLAREKG